jgi:hypothetical protein
LARPFGYRSGIEFIEPTEHALAAIHAFVEALKFAASAPPPIRRGRKSHGRIDPSRTRGRKPPSTYNNLSSTDVDSPAPAARRSRIAIPPIPRLIGVFQKSHGRDVEAAIDGRRAGLQKLATRTRAGARGNPVRAAQLIVERKEQFRAAT